jgi:hypothetical protein
MVVVPIYLHIFDPIEKTSDHTEVLKASEQTIYFLETIDQFAS